jgi:hypothetical protein
LRAQAAQASRSATELRLILRQFKQRFLIVIGCLMLTSLCAFSQGQDGWGNYQVRTLKQIVDQHSEIASNEKAKLNLLFSADLFPSKVKGIYSGEIRKISATRKEFIAEWAKTRKASPELVNLFEEELLFKEGDAGYWLPVQKQVIPFLREELKAGDRVELYLIWIGTRSEGGVTDWFFLVNEFQKDQSSTGAVEQALGAGSPEG